jgi:hypothetical protein
LSKYSAALTPERSVNRPVSWHVARRSAARVEFGTAGIVASGGCPAETGYLLTGLAGMSFLWPPNGTMVSDAKGTADIAVVLARRPRCSGRRARKRVEEKYHEWPTHWRHPGQ